MFKLNALEQNEQEFRCLYVSLKLKLWMENELPALTSTWNTELSCLEQVDALTGEFCAGETLIHGPQFHALKPPAECVWALKTGDVRIFGWFTAQISLLQVQHGSRAADLVGCDHSSVLGALRTIQRCIWPSLLKVHNFAASESFKTPTL